MVSSMFANGLEPDVIANIAGMTVPEVRSILESSDNLQITQLPQTLTQCL